MNSEVEKIRPPFDPVWERIKILTGWAKYGEFAKLLGIDPASVSGAKKRGFISLEWIFKVAQSYNGSSDWLATGKGEMRRGAVVDESAVAHAKTVAADPGEPFARDVESEELCRLLKRYGNRALVEDVKARLLKIKQVVEG